MPRASRRGRVTKKAPGQGGGSGKYFFEKIILVQKLAFPDEQKHYLVVLDYYNAASELILEKKVGPLTQLTSSLKLSSLIYHCIEFL